MSRYGEMRKRSKAGRGKKRGWWARFGERRKEEKKKEEEGEGCQGNGAETGSRLRAEAEEFVMGRGA